MDPGALRWVLAVIGLLVIAGVYLFTAHQNRLRRRHAFRTLTQDELEQGTIEDENLREELSSITSMLKEDDLREDVSHIRINPALDASLHQHRPRREPLHLPLVMQRVANQNLVGHILKHGDNQLLTGSELAEAFSHVGLSLTDEGLLTPTDLNCFIVANLTEQGDFLNLNDEQFTTGGFVCFFDISALQQPRACYEIMLKKVDELVRLLDLRVYNEDLQLLTLEHVTSTRERLREMGGD
jgi:FtsZ-interacting cell division protein ZipA